jgi:hypothetical protein
MIKNLLEKNTGKKIWLDLELREDIDDYLTLVFALENRLNVTEVSIHNPSVHELGILNKTISLYNSSASVIVSGDITNYPEAKDIHTSLLSILDKEFNIKHVRLDEYLYKTDMEDKTVFCGGSLFTLSKILKSHNETVINAYIQGGYASKEVAGIENTLKKFTKRNAVPTWNLNLDLDASDYVMKAPNVNCHFVSKNVCHNSWVHLSDVNSNKGLFNEAIRSYFGGNTNGKKCMHDLVAFLTIFNDDIVGFKTVNLYRTDDERPKWHSEIDENSNKKISINLDFDLFTRFIRKYKAPDNDTED